MMDRRHFVRFGEHIPYMHLKTLQNPRFAFGSLAGRYVMLIMIDDWQKYRKDLLPSLEKMGQFFNAQHRVPVCVVQDPDFFKDSALEDLKERFIIVDDCEDHAFFKALGLYSLSETQNDEVLKNPSSAVLLLDPQLRVLASWPIEQCEEASDLFARLAEPEKHAGVEQIAPVLIVPRIFEPGFCKALIEYYQKQGGSQSGVTRERDGRTLVELDDSVKKRFDCSLEDEQLKNDAMQRVFWRLIPQIQKAFQFHVTRMERYIVCCYDSESGGYFRPHRDNTTKGTAHRRFAVSINLNAEEFEGGDLRFPEYGSRTYRAPTGGAVVFSCSMLHEATPITKGQRFAFLPFLYDDAAAKIREENNQFVDEKSVGHYKSEQ